MEEIRNTFGNDDNPPATTIVSTMTTVTGNGTNVTLNAPQTIDNFEPDPKWEMTTLEKASYEPTTEQAQEQQEDKSVFGSCILSQSSVDTQMEKVIDDIVELDRCQQFVQASDYHQQQNIVFDREKEVADIQREISGNLNSETSESNANDKVEEKLSTDIEKNEQQELCATSQQSNQDLKQTDDLATPESRLEVLQQAINHQDSPQFDAMSNQINEETEQPIQITTIDSVENNNQIHEATETRVTDSVEQWSVSNVTEGVVAREVGMVIEGDVVETNVPDTNQKTKSDSIEDELTKIKEDEIYKMIDDKSSEVDNDKVTTVKEKEPSFEIVAEEVIKSVDTSVQETNQEETSEPIKDEVEAEKEKLSKFIEDEMPEINEETGTAIQDESTFVVSRETSEIATVSDVTEEKFPETCEDEATSKEEDLPKIVEEKISTIDVDEASICDEDAQTTHGVGSKSTTKAEKRSSTVVERKPTDVEKKFSADDETRNRGSRLSRPSRGTKNKVPPVTPSPATMRRSKRTKVESEPKVEKVKIKENTTAPTTTTTRRPDCRSSSYKCTHCEYASERLDNLIYHMKHKMCEPLKEMWNQRCNEFKKILQKSPSTKKRQTR